MSAACEHLPAGKAAPDTPQRSAETGPLGALRPDEARLVAFCCAVAVSRAAELLEGMSPHRADILTDAAKALAGLERSVRLSYLARHLSPERRENIDASRALRGEPPSVTATACLILPPKAREALLTDRDVRASWKAGRRPHPAFLSYLRRRLARV